MAEALNIPVSKVRRNTKEFLGDDPRAARRAGVKREFSLNDGFFVYLGGELVTNHNLSYGNARRALDVIKPWLLKNHLVPDHAMWGKREGIDAGDEEEHTEFYVAFYLSEGLIQDFCEIRVVAVSDITENLVDALGRKYHRRSVNEGYYHIRNNQGKLEYFTVYTERVPGKGLTIRSTTDDEEATKIWRRSKQIGEIPISKMFSDFLNSITSVT